MKKIKLLILLLLSLSVYFIHQKTKDTKETILVLGDYLSEGIDSYHSHTYTYIDYYKEYSNKQKVKIINYSKKDLSLKELLNNLKMTPSLKKDLREANTLLLNLGYSDLVFKLSLEENKNLEKIIEEIDSIYKELIQEIRKYYKERIMVIGYPSSYKEDYYLNQGIKELNKVLRKELLPTDIFINTYELLKEKEKYFSNPNSNYPNSLAYQIIGKEIINKIQ